MKRRSKVLSCALVITMLLFLLPGTVFAADRTYIDDLNRTITLPETINSWVPSGPMAQYALFSVDPSMLAAWASAPTTAQKDYIDYDTYPNLEDLPVVGQIYGGSTPFDADAVIDSGADVIVDVGQIKGDSSDMAEAFNDLEDETGIPVVFIHAEDIEDANGYDYARLYEKLAEVLGPNASTAVLNHTAALENYCADTVGYIQDQRATIPSAVANARSIYYGEGPSGLQTNGTTGPGAIHQTIIPFIGGVNVATINSPSGKGLTNVTIAQVQSWNPSAVIFGPDSYYNSVYSDPNWAGIAAVQNEKVAQVPDALYNWIGRPPSINRVLGAQWLAHIMFPEYYPAYDTTAEMRDIVQDYYENFYHWELTPTQLNTIMSTAEFNDPSW